VNFAPSRPARLRREPRRGALDVAGREVDAAQAVGAFELSPSTASGSSVRTTSQACSTVWLACGPPLFAGAWKRKPARVDGSITSARSR
jgi:hypothetical protein